MDRITLDRLIETYKLTYQHHSPVECDFVGDLNRLMWAVEDYFYGLKSNQLIKLSNLDSFINSIDRIVWSEQTASCDTYEQAYNKVKRELLEALEEFRKKNVSDIHN